MAFQIPLLPFFQGIWDFTRTVNDLKTGGLLNRATGQAVFNKEDDLSTLQYREDGRDETGQNFFRHYRYDEIENSLNVLYGDGPDTGKLYLRYIPSLCGNLLIACEIHLCGTDRYIGHYEFIDDKNFALVTSVRGQNKNYIIETNYRRA